MLSTLHIENIAVIEHASINFERGFNVLTGETGAGKSIIIDSIGAILGQRTSRELIRKGSSKGFVSAIFTDISKELRDIIKELSLTDEDENTLYISRELSENGKSTCRVNMKPVTASVLKQISPFLINIHGQHDGQQLLNSDFHIDYLDDYCNKKDILMEYRSLYSALISIKRKIVAIEKNEQERLRRMEILSFQIDEIESADIVYGEEGMLLDQRSKLQNAEKIISALNFAKNSLYGNEDTDGAFGEVSFAVRSLSGISGVSKPYAELLSKVESIKYLMEDIVSDISALEDDIDTEGLDISVIEQRLDVIYKMRQKYGNDENEILIYLDDARQELLELSTQNETRDELMEEYRIKLKNARELSEKISVYREEYAKKLETEIVEQLSGLDMSKISFKVYIQKAKTLGAKGSDKVEFLIATNAGESLKPLAKIASGGELSRIMLAIKNVLSQTDKVDTMIFDEIDTGVSGRAAQKIGYKLWQISKNRQVLCVTHLAQIAAIADMQFLIEKSTKDNSTYTKVEMLESEERRHELARIIAGDNITETSLKTADEMIIQSNLYKENN